MTKQADLLPKPSKEAAPQEEREIPLSLYDLQRQTLNLDGVFPSWEEEPERGGEIFLLAILLNPACKNPQNPTRKYRLPVFVFTKTQEKGPHATKASGVFVCTPECAYTKAIAPVIERQLSKTDAPYHGNTCGYLLPEMTKQQRSAVLRNMQTRHSRYCKWQFNGYADFDDHTDSAFYEGRAKPAALSLMPRVHNKGVIPKESGYGVCLYVGLACVNHLFLHHKIDNDDLYRCQKYLKDERLTMQDGVSSSANRYADRRSKAASTMWDKMFLRGQSSRNRYFFRPRFSASDPVTLNEVARVENVVPYRENGVLRAPEEQNSPTHITCDEMSWQQAQKYVIGLFDYNIRNNGVCSTDDDDVPLQIVHPELILGLDVEGLHVSVINFLSQILADHVRWCQEQSLPCVIRESDVAAFERYAKGSRRRNPDDDDVTEEEYARFMQKRNAVIAKLDQEGDLP